MHTSLQVTSRSASAAAWAAPSTSGRLGVSSGVCGRRARTNRVLAASLFDDMTREFSAMDRQFAAMEREIAEVDRELEDVGRQMDREINGIFQRTQTSLEQQRLQLQQQLEQEERLLQQQAQERQRLLQAQPGGGVYFEARESSGAYSSFSYYRSYTLSIPGEGVPRYQAPAADAGAPISPMVLVAALLASAHVAVAATFVKNYHLTTYGPKWRWSLSLLWPLLAILDQRFREQLVSAVRGVRVPVLKREDETQTETQAESQTQVEVS